MKLLPQFSLRLMLGITAAVAGVFSIVGLAVRGHGWAIGLSLGVGAMAVTLATYAAFFGVLWVFSVVSSPFLDRRIAFGRATRSGTSSPFADPSRVPAVEVPVDAIVIDAPETAMNGTADSRGGEQ